MIETANSSRTLNLGQKVERIRECKGLKQEYVANQLGISQQTYSKIEQQDEIEQEILVKIAAILQVSPEAIKNFDDERMTYIINHQYNIYNNEIKDNATNTFVFNPIEKIVELYERLIASEKEKIEISNKLNEK